MYNSFELFFFWRKCSTVVAVGVQTSFLLLCVDWLIDFFEEREKAMCQLWVDCKKCDRKKQQKGGLCGGRQKDRASPVLRQAQQPACSVTEGLNELTRKGGDFCLPGIPPRRSCP